MLLLNNNRILYVLYVFYHKYKIRSLKLKRYYEISVKYFLRNNRSEIKKSMLSSFFYLNQTSA